ncbi:hypothetical protein CC1G_11068 [Coprinopsis cinerea okayama7|uniref:Uncharacterized protein n=1 Tax=Coprinopsis cinerea (strain Okayama-7 / 130 / ATCC MYA-4618 / FGSC 9003) TaxID=240176 RepID=A8NC99_COPC7|nr:hypothetical protein CC1G_11068 [Coprinopsis cinerea okayama7\|eukprot:XP_001832443.2 hypothetical protein CC1G_11068 [Coprinopsis cinerea okayama7\
MSSVDGPQSSDNFAFLPLTLWDNLSHQGLTKAWLVEGILDPKKIEEALDRVVAKWPVLAGRVEVTGKKRYQMKIPLGTLPPDYKAYIVTSTTSDVPLSHYVKVPLAPVTKFPPADLFVTKERAQMNTLDAYAAQSAPFTHWHLTHFKQPGEEFTCLGVNYSHGILDGVGFGMVMHAFQAELSGTEWDAPPLPSPGLNENVFGTVMEREYQKFKQQSTREPYPNWRVAGFGGLLVFLAKSFWHNWRYGVGDYNFVIPFSVHTKLVKEARRALEEEGVTDIRPSGGDIMTSWLMQATFMDGGDSRRLIGLQNVGSLRDEWDRQFKQYPHNCCTTLRCPPISVHDLTTLPVHQIAYKVAHARVHGNRIADAVAQYDLLHEADRTSGFPLPVHGAADDHFIMSNVSVARISELNFRGAGGGPVLCHYKYFPESPFTLTNMFGNNGRLENGDLIVNATIDNPRASRLESELQKLIERFKE